MHYYLALTSKCDLNCKYCMGKCVNDFMTIEEASKYDLTLPAISNVSINELKKFCNYDKDFAITFYGGEPLLQISKIKEIIDNVPAKEFMIQTNAQKLNELPTKYINKFTTILTSIDGTKEHTDERRGKRVYDKVISNVKSIRKNNFSGEIIARMTVDETCDIFENVTHLYNLNLFDSIHWQIDAQFFASDYQERNFKKWIDSDYNPKISKLINWWFSQIEQGKIIKLYPFIGIMKSLLTNEKSPMRCGAGHSCLGIQTDGKIVACPITAGYKPLYMGDIRKSNLKDIISAKITPDKQCLTCEIKDICGGRCLYANQTQLWGNKGYSEVCCTIFHLVNELKRIEPEIKKLISENKIKLEDFDYKKYNGCEIIP